MGIRRWKSVPPAPGNIFKRLVYRLLLDCLCRGRSSELGKGGLLFLASVAAATTLSLTELMVRTLLHRFLSHPVHPCPLFITLLLTFQLHLLLVIEDSRRGDCTELVKTVVGF